MARHKQLIVIRNAKLRERFASLCEKRKEGKQINSYSSVIATLSSEFYLAERTIENIVMSQEELIAA